MQKLQLDAVSYYLWEMFYDLALGLNEDNVSRSPGFEAFSLRVNNLSEDESNNCKKRHAFVNIIE